MIAICPAGPPNEMKPSFSQKRKASQKDTRRPSDCCEVSSIPYRRIANLRKLGRLAAEFITATEHVVGPQEAIEAICIGPDDDMESRRKDIAKAIAKVDLGKGVIILTDLFGGTPSNLAISLMKGENVEVIAGVNLPMLIRLEGARKVMPVHAAVAAAREAGRKYISVASEILGEAAA